MTKIKETQTIDMAKGIKLDGDIERIYGDYIVLKKDDLKIIYDNNKKKKIYKQKNCNIKKLEKVFQITDTESNSLNRENILINLDGEIITKNVIVDYLNPVLIDNDRLLINNIGYEKGIMYDLDGNEIYKCKNLELFNEGLYEFYDSEKSNRNGLVDKDGFIKLEPKYFKIYDYNKDYYVVMIKGLYEMKYYLYNKKTKKKKRWKDIVDFRKIDEDRFVYKKKNNHTVLIDDNFLEIKDFGDKVYPFEFETYKNSLTVLKSNNNVINKFGETVLDATGKVIDILLNKILLYEEKINTFYILEGNKVQEFGNVSFKKQFNNLIELIHNNKPFIINSDGKIISDSDYEIVKNIGDKYLLKSTTMDRYKIIDELGNNIVPEVDQKLVIGEDNIGVSNVLVNYSDIKINYHLSIELDDKIIHKSFDTVEARNRYKEVFEEMIQQKINDIDNETNKIINSAIEKKHNLFNKADHIVSKKLIKKI